MDKVTTGTRNSCCWRYIAQDELRKKVLKAAAGNLKLGIYTTEQAIESIPKGNNRKKNFFLISNSPQTFAELVKLGVDFGKQLNVGPMNTREGAKVLGRTVAIDQKDYEAFEYITSKRNRSFVSTIAR